MELPCQPLRTPTGPIPKSGIFASCRQLKPTIYSSPPSSASFSSAGTVATTA